MPVYRTFRLRDSRRETFRWAPHTSGVTNVKPRDYDEDESVEAPTPYALWGQLRESAKRLDLGDLIESTDGQLYIYKYVGFEQARWVLPEITTGMEGMPAAAGPVEQPDANAGFGPEAA
jgi:hypothetical protein